MTRRRLAAVLFALMAGGLFWNQVSTESSRWILGATLALPFVAAGAAVLAGKQWGLYIGLGVAIVGLVMGGFVVAQANLGGGSQFTGILDLFGAGGCYSCWDVALGAIVFVLLSMMVADLVVVLMRDRPRRASDR
jgi:hypothetical protein